MKFEQSIIIHLDRARVIELFDSTENLLKWQPGLLEFTHLEGTPGEVGAKSRLRYQMGKREVEMIETITMRKLPDEFSGTYEANGVWNEVRNFFRLTPDGETEWRTKNEFRFTGFMKCIGLLMPGAFRKQSMMYMEAFKEFAEKEGE